MPSSDTPGDPSISFKEAMQALFALEDKLFQEKTLGGRIDIAHEMLKNPLCPQTFYYLWFLVHQVYPCLGLAWTDDGFNPAASPVAGEVLILAASYRGHECILNGGFHQFFFNKTGVFAPEMVEWLQLVDLPRYAALLKETMTLFGTEYPRSQEKRDAILDEAGSHGYDWLDEKIRELENSGEIGIFETKVEDWLREHLGVRDLQTPPAVNPQYARNS